MVAGDKIFESKDGIDARIRWRQNQWCINNVKMNLSEFNNNNMQMFFYDEINDKGDDSSWL